MRNLVAALVLIILILSIAVYRLSEAKPQPQPGRGQHVTFRYEPEALAIIPVFRPGDVLTFVDSPKWEFGSDPCEHGSPCTIKKLMPESKAIFSIDCGTPKPNCQDPEIAVDDSIILETALSTQSQNGARPGDEPPKVKIGCDSTTKTLMAVPSKEVAPMNTRFVWVNQGEPPIPDWQVTVQTGSCMADNGGSNTIFNSSNRACTVLTSQPFTYMISSPSNACNPGTGMVAPN
jgi:hypothetical protein